MDDLVGGSRVSGKEWAVHSVLFLLTGLTATVAGVQWLNKDPLELSNLAEGLPYSGLILLFLASHEMGHYFAARAHHVSSTLPYFIPFPSFLGLFPFGTLGAVIRLRQRINSATTLFDIGAAGPIAGFVASLGMLVIGFLTLPPLVYLYSIHPDYAHLQIIPADGLRFGGSMIYRLIELSIPGPASYVPPMTEIYHYPLLCVGWFGMFVTAMNLLPVGQLDGGHICTALFPRHSRSIQRITLVLLLLLGTAGLLPLVGIDAMPGWSGWLIWALLLFFFLRRARGTQMPENASEPLDLYRRLLGWVCFAILLLTFVPVPISL